MACDTIWWHRTVSASVQVMVCCLTAPSLYLNPCWFLISEVLWHLSQNNFIASAQVSFLLQASKFQIECTCPSGKWIVKITCPNVPFTCLKYIKPMQLMWKSEICSHPSDKSCRYSTCPTVIFTLRRSDEWNFEPCFQGQWVEEVPN